MPTNTLKSLFGSLRYQPLQKENIAGEVNGSASQEAAVAQRSDRTTKILKVSYLGACFFVQFTAYGTSQGYAAKLFGELGQNALAMTYFSWMICCLFGPYIVSKLSGRLSFIVGFIPYTIFIFSVATRISYLLIPACMGVGFGASIIWVAQGLYVTEVADGQEVGFYFSRFSTIMGLSAILGNLITGVFLELEIITVNQTLWIMVSLGCLSFLMTFFVRPSNSSHQPPILTPSKAILEVLEYLKDIKLWLLVPAWLYAGLLLWVLNGKVTPAIDIDYIPFFLLFHGIGRLAGTFIWGPLYDRFSVTPLLLAWLFFGIASQITTHILAEQVLFNWGILVSAGLLVGLSGSASETMTNVSIMKLYKSNSKPAFAVSRLCGALIAAVLFFVAPHMSALSLTILGGVVVLIGTVSAFILHKKYVDQISRIVLDNVEITEVESDEEIELQKKQDTIEDLAEE